MVNNETQWDGMGLAPQEGILKLHYYEVHILQEHNDPILLNSHSFHILGNITLGNWME